MSVRSMHNVPAVVSMLAIIALIAGSSTRASAADPITVRRSAIAWLETQQDEDGSWGGDPLATSEALNALAKAGRAAAPASQKAIGWLRSHEYESFDFRARAVRALISAGAEAEAVADPMIKPGLPAGWGPTSPESPTSYDTGLVMGALELLGQQSTPVEEIVVAGTRLTELNALRDRRQPSPGLGWAGDQVPEPNQPGTAFVTAEILRAMAPWQNDGVGDDYFQPGQWVFETARQALLLQSPPGPATETLDLASRLAAFRALGITSVNDPNDPNGVPIDITSTFEPLLVADTRLVDGVWSDDAFTNAIGLLALTTKPGANFEVGSDWDDDLRPNETDAFPWDVDEQDDRDGDGVGNKRDPDDDGDGVPDAQDALPLEPTESRDTDGDGDGDSKDSDDDDDGIPDAVEIANGTNPLSDDSDGDGLADLSDPYPRCPAPDHDADADGVCSPLDACPYYAGGTTNLDGDALCDPIDPDRDGDGFDDIDEIAFGSDPSDGDSMPTLPGAGDYDGDGLSNVLEIAFGTSRFRADTDSDGATDHAEKFGGTDPLVASSQPPAVVAAFSGITTADVAEASESGLRLTVSGAQSTPTALAGVTDSRGSGAGVFNLAGFQPMAGLGMDADLDGLAGWREDQRRSSPFMVDTDGDGFVDGPGDRVLVSSYTGPMTPWNLDGNAFVDGEDPVTDPTDPEDHPGMPGDVAPFGHPDGKVNSGDWVLELRLVQEPELLAFLTGQNREIAEQAAELDGSPGLEMGDWMRLYQRLEP